jgi:hypothetical protein
MQAMGNTYYAYTHLVNFQGWIELFGLTEEDLIYQKRVLSIVSGAILPIVALGFIKSLVDYIKPSDDIVDSNPEEIIEERIGELEEKIDELEEKVEDVVDGGDSNEIESGESDLFTPTDNIEIIQNPNVINGESIEPLNIGRYNTTVEVDPTKIN